MICKTSWILRCSGYNVFLASVTSDKRLKAEENYFNDDEDNPSETQGAFSNVNVIWHWLKLNNGNIADKLNVIWHWLKLNNGNIADKLKYWSVFYAYCRRIYPYYLSLPHFLLWKTTTLFVIYMCYLKLHNCDIKLKLIWKSNGKLHCNILLTFSKCICNYSFYIILYIYDYIH